MGFGKRRGTGQEFYKIKIVSQCVDQLGVLGGETDDNIEDVIVFRKQLQFSITTIWLRQ